MFICQTHSGGMFRIVPFVEYRDVCAVRRVLDTNGSGLFSGHHFFLFNVEKYSWAMVPSRVVSGFLDREDRTRRPSDMFR